MPAPGERQRHRRARQRVRAQATPVPLRQADRRKGASAKWVQAADPYAGSSTCKTSFVIAKSSAVRITVAFALGNGFPGRSCARIECRSRWTDTEYPVPETSWLPRV